MSSKHRQVSSYHHSQVLLILALAFGVQIISQPAAATGESQPSGTLLLPLTPKVDMKGFEPEDEESAAQPVVQPVLQKDQVTDESTRENAVDNTSDDFAFEDPLKSFSSDQSVTAGGEREFLPRQSGDNKYSLEVDVEDGSTVTGRADKDEVVDEDTTLKGTIQIVADDTEFDQEKNTFLGTGNAVCIIGGQNSKLEADMILYDQDTETINARGHVTIIRDGEVSTGKAFKFNVASDEYLITSPDTEINGATIIARTGTGLNDGITFKDGTLKMPEPILFGKNFLNGPLGYWDDHFRRERNPGAFLPAKQGFKFKARKIVYEKYLDENNLTVYGGKLMMGKFGVPLGKFRATINREIESDIVFPVAPEVSNLYQMGGVNIGPKFNHIIGKEGILSWAPMIQMGSRSTSGTGNSGGLGVSGLASYRTKKLNMNIAAGSVSKMMVADLHYEFSPTLRLQSGINRFMDDGMLGFRRARMQAELVHRKMLTNVPYLHFLSFRSSGGWAQDNPRLVNFNSAYANLFGGTQTSRIMPSAFKIQEQIAAQTHPLFAIGNEKYGAKGSLFGFLSLRGYSSGDMGAIGQIGPIFHVNLDKVRLMAQYNQAAVRGSTPFLFDQYVQGTRSVNLMGDIKVNKYLRIGGGLGYNLDSKLTYSRSISAAIGPDDFKVLLSREMLTGMNRMGFDVLYGSPSAFKTLTFKRQADHGQLGGI